MIRGTVRRGTGSDQAAPAQHMGTGERGCQECDGERRGRGRVLAAGRSREKKLHAATRKTRRHARAGVTCSTVRKGTGSDRAAHAQHMGTGERGCPECDGERSGRGRSLAASTKKSSAPRTRKSRRQARARVMRGADRRGAGSDRSTPERNIYRIADDLPFPYRYDIQPIRGYVTVLV